MIQVVFCDNMIEESQKALANAIISTIFAIILVFLMQISYDFSVNSEVKLAFTIAAICVWVALWVYRYLELRCYRLVVLEDRIIVKSLISTKAISISDIKHYRYREVARSNVYAFTVYFLGRRTTFYTRRVRKTLQALKSK